MPYLDKRPELGRCLASVRLLFVCRWWPEPYPSLAPTSSRLGKRQLDSNAVTRLPLRISLPCEAAESSLPFIDPIFDPALPALWGQFSDMDL